MIDVRHSDLGEVSGNAFGGKAAGLGRLCRSGLPVPDGFAVSATTVDPSQWSAPSRSELLARFRPLLEDGPIAIRSSALGEDAADRSFAGLFQSVLNVGTEEQALAAAATCIASGAAERVLSYARRTEPIPVGLVVQRMVDARTAGVAFSRDPTGQDPATLVEAVEGLGEGLVSGQVTPETWRVYRTGLGDLDARRSGPAEVLPATRACEIATVARRTAEQWQQDLDMEWALDVDDALWWLQARPITTGAPWRAPVVSRSALGADDGPISVWSNVNLRESMPDPLHPLSWSVWKTTLVPAVTRSMTHIPESAPAFAQAGVIDLVNGRLYVNLNAVLGSPPFGSLMLRLPSPLDDSSSQTVRDLARRGVLRPRRNPGAWPAMLRGLLSGLIPGKRNYPSPRDPAAWLDALAACAEDIRARPPTGTLSDEALLTEIQILGQPEMSVLRKGLDAANPSVFIWLAATRLFRPWPEAARRLATGVSGNPTTDISLGIDRLVQQARPLASHFDTGQDAPAVLAHLRTTARDDEVVRHWLQGLDRFLIQFGHRVPREYDLAVPRWVEDPTMVIDLVRAGLADAERESLAERLDRLGQAREASVQEAIQAARPWRRPLLRWAARAVPAWMPMREAPKHHIMQAFLRSRQAALELGQRLSQTGVLAAAEDIFFLEIEELAGIVRHGQAAPAELVQRRLDLKRWLAAAPASLVRSDGVPVEEPADGFDPDELRGHGIGGGIGEGPVTILEEPDPRQVHDGDVLVVTFADPAWTPLFTRASAVVMEIGGTMCHAAVVARELGIPAVFAVRGAKSRLTAGERVRVDGDAGRVYRLAGDA